MSVEDLVVGTITRIGGTITRFTEKLTITDSRDQVAVFNRKGDGEELDDGINCGVKERRTRVGFALASTIWGERSAGRTGYVKGDGAGSGCPGGNVAVTSGVGEVSSNEEARLLTPIASPAVLKKREALRAKPAASMPQKSEARESG